jgi:hypothetical protein
MTPESGCTGPRRQWKGRRVGKRGGGEGERREVPALAGEGQGDPSPVPAGVTPVTSAEIVAYLRVRSESSFAKNSINYITPSKMQFIHATMI